MFRSKKGMSPLIATVLLIAFAVAMGAMIMNWSSGVAAEGKIATEVCEEISITSLEGACYSGNSITFDVRNNGRKKVDGLLLTSSDSSSVLDIRVKDSSLIVGENTEKTVPFFYGGGDIELTFIPLVSGSDELVQCDAEGFSQNVLPDC